jgi:hypothetical protein
VDYLQNVGRTSQLLVALATDLNVVITHYKSVLAHHLAKPHKPETAPETE